jgi:hypothetical protein
MVFQSEQEDEPYLNEGGAGETNVGQKAESINKSKVTRNANVSNTETSNHEGKTGGLEERLARLPFLPAKLDCEIATMLKGFAIWEGSEEGMSELLKAAATIPDHIIPVVAEAP